MPTLPFDGKHLSLHQSFKNFPFFIVVIKEIASNMHLAMEGEVIVYWSSFYYSQIAKGLCFFDKLLLSLVLDFCELAFKLPQNRKTLTLKVDSYIKYTFKRETYSSQGKLGFESLMKCPSFFGELIFLNVKTTYFVSHFKWRFGPMMR